MTTIKKAFTLGKFLPFHNGHKAMISYALTLCQELTIIVCASDKETIDALQRCQWIKNSFTHQPITIIPFQYNEADLPNTSESSDNISQIWAKALSPLIDDCQAVITSEDYGDYIAKYLNITHFPFDKTRQQIPISATLIRQDPKRYWHRLPNAVKKDLAFTIVILGTESTGKTTLTKKLAAHYQATPVYEAGRDIVEDSNNFQFELLPLIAQTHATAISEAKQKDNPITIIDTDIHITASYAQFCFQRDLIIPTHIYEANKANLYLYLDNDAPFIQDGTRMPQEQRNRLDQNHKQTLKKYHINYITIQGDWETRFQQACLHIDQKLKLYFPLKLNLST